MTDVPAPTPPKPDDETLYKGHAIGTWYTETWVGITLCGRRFENVRMLVYGEPRCKICHREASRVKAETEKLWKARAAVKNKGR